MSIREQLAGKKAREKADLKGQEIVRISIKEKVVRPEYDIEIVDIERIDGGVQVFVRAWKDKHQIGFGKDGSVDIERFRIFNPPILVPDKDGDIVKEVILDEETRETVMRHFREDPKEAIIQSLEHTLSVMKNIHFDSKTIESEKRGNTTSTFYPAAGANSPVDGYVRRVGDASWATTRDTADGTDANDTFTNAIFVRSRDATTSYQLYRGVMCFDTSILGIDTIDSAVYSFAARGGADGDDANGYTVDIVDLTLASTAAIAVGDYDAFGTTAYASFDVSNWVNTDGTYNNWTFTDTSIINKSGVTQLGFRMSGDINDTAPTGNNSIGGYFADQTGTSVDPKLVVEHTTPSTNVKTWDGIARANVKTLMGVGSANIKTINGIA